jgi:hypothetical protein
MTVHDAALTGDRRQALVAIRDSLARAMDDAEPGVLAQLSGQLVRVLAEIDQIGTTREASTIDELRAKRRKAG